jgi:PadR family transcriptional regulator, regulatory protein PadR
LRPLPDNVILIRYRKTITYAAPNAIYSSLIRLHILHHASKEPIWGLGIIEELGRHGYRLSAGTLYPLLHGLEREGYLRSFEKRNGRHARRLYKATSKGRRSLRQAKTKVRELFAELFEDA